MHFVFSLIKRRTLLEDAAIRDQMYNYVGEICNNFGCPILRVGSVADVVHLLCGFR
jgi:REP element-mobilizing transposase RayT